MKAFHRFIIFSITMLFLTNNSYAALEFDARKNGVELYGPYVKYNFLKKPYSFGQNLLQKEDIRLEVRKTENFELTKEEKSNPPADAKKYLYAMWPKFLTKEGRFELYTADEKKVYYATVSPRRTQEGKELLLLRFPADWEERKKVLEEGVFFCVENTQPESYTKFCSDKLKLIGDRFITMNPSEKAKTLLNSKKVPRNAQINLAEEDKEIEFFVQFESGMKIFLKDKIRKIKLDNVAIDIKSRQLAIMGKAGPPVKTKPAFKEKFWQYLKEKNYFRDKFTIKQQGKRDLTDADMEFAPYTSGASFQLYGLSLSDVPPSDFNMKLDDDAPIATYAPMIRLRGEKTETENVFSETKGELLVSPDKKKLLWKFPTLKKGAMNKNYIIYKKGDYEYYFTKRIFRAHRASVSGGAGISTNVKLSVVPGYNIDAEYWPEKLGGNHWALFQRWGFKANMFQTISKFSATKGTGEIKLGIMSVDANYRFTKGVRPVQKTFGLSAKLLRPTVQLTGFGASARDSTFSPNLLGVGAFWHTAPQKIVDDFFNVVPFFRYPKWMEVSLYLYPIGLGTNIEQGLAFSYHARGRLFFARNWFFDASFNVHSMLLKRSGEAQLTISTAHGTLGFGYLF